MLKWQRPLSLGLIIALITVFIAPLLSSMAVVTAQDNCPAGLTPEDCNFLNTAQQTMDAVQSLYIEAYEIDLQAVFDEQLLTLTVVGSGPVMLTGDQVAVDIQLDNADLAVDGETYVGTGVFRMVDDRAFLGNGEGDAINWQGVAWNELSTSSDLLDVLIETLGEFDLSLFFVWSRGADVVIDGETLAVFQADLDVAALLSSAALIELLAEIALETIESDFLTPSTAAILISTLLDQVAAEIIEGTIVRFTQYIDPGTYLLQSVALEITFDMGFDFLRGFAPEVDAALPTGNLSIDLEFQAMLGQHDASFTINPPAAYEDVTDDLIALLEALLSGGLSEDGLPFGTGEVGTDGSAEFDISFGEEAMGILSPINATDTYRFVASAGDRVQIGLRAEDPTGFLDPKMELYSIEGHLLEENDDAFNAPPEFNLGSLDSYIAAEIPTDGEYLIKVTSVFVVEQEEPYTLILAVE